MGIKHITRGTTAPEGSHLAVLADIGTVKAFPVGTTFVFIGDAADRESWVPMILMKATIKSWDFKCACGNPKCNRVYKYKATMEGGHPYK